MPFRLCYLGVNRIITEPYPWYKKRTYSHFDRPIGLKKAAGIVACPDLVEHHAFLPFLLFVITEQRYKRDERKVRPKKREVMYASHIDAHIFSYYAMNLQSLYEDKLLELGIKNEPIAYRKIDKKCNIHFAHEAFEHAYKQENGVAIAADITDFFGSLNHRILKAQWETLIGKESLPPDHYAVFKAITKYSYVELEKAFNVLGVSKSKQRTFRGQMCTVQEFREKIRSKGIVESNTNNHGIPQGSPISALISNIYMMDFDRVIAKEACKYGAYYRRYSDDILIICAGDKKEHFRTLLSDTLKTYKLEPNNSKEQVSVICKMDKVISIHPPLQYLGFIFDGEKTLIRSQTIARQKRRAKSAVKSAATAARIKGSSHIYRQKLYSLHSHLKNRHGKTSKKKYSKGNFYSYVRRSTTAMEDDSIKRQMKSHWPWLNKLIIESENDL